MNRTYTKWWLTATLMAISLPVFPQKYSIHLAAFTQQIEPSFFSYAGFSHVHHQVHSFNFHQYAWGNFSTLEAAQNQLNTLQKNLLLKGLSNLSIMPLATNLRVSTTDSNID